jgi:prevent-host-death family protein
MQVKNTLSISDARKQLFSIADEVQSPDTYYTLTERGRPKVVILSTERFESIVNQQNIQITRAMAMLDWEKEQSGKSFSVREVPMRTYGDMLPKKHTTFVLQEAPRVMYVDRKSSGDRYQAKELAKAQLYVELIERYRYPLYLVEVGRYVKVGGNESKRYTEADIMISGSQNNFLVLFSVSAMAVYDERLDASFHELFDIAEALAYRTDLQTRLTYYSRSYDEKNGAKHRFDTVSFNEYPSYDGWVAAERPTKKELPSYDDMIKAHADQDRSTTI